MADPDGTIAWYSAKRRGIFELDGLKISRSLRRTIAKHAFDIRFDTAFVDVMRACATRPETWISEEVLVHNKAVLVSNSPGAPEVMSTNRRLQAALRQTGFSIFPSISIACAMRRAT